MTHGFAFGNIGARKVAARKEKSGTLKPLLVDGKPFTMSTICSGQCRWPYQLIKGELVMCGRPVERAPYCTEHRALASGGKGGRL